MRVYFAHPVSDYGTPRETAAAAVMEAVGWSVENPNQPHHQRGYDAGGMGYFEQIARACDGLAFMRFPNGAIGAGVGKEVGAALDASKPVYELFDGEVHLVTGMPTPVLSVAATRALLTELQHRREEVGVTAPDIDMARHWIDRYAAGIDEEPQMSRILDALGVSALGEHP